MDSHTIVSRVKELAIELQRRPTRDEFIKLVPKAKMVAAFGSFTALLQAAGLGTDSPDKEQIKKRIQKFFDPSNHDTTYNRPVTQYTQTYEPTVFIPDTHFPWANEDAFTLLYFHIEELYKENNGVLNIVQLGDLYDMFSFAKFPRTQLLIKPDDEITQARSQAEKMWESIKRIAPKAKCFQLLGNHCIRPMKRILESNSPELEAFFNFKPLFEFEGVTTIHDIRTPLKIGNVSVIHGHLTGIGKHLSMGTHVVHGHTHNGGLIYKKIDGKWLWELDCGYLGNIDAKCFSYTSVKPAKWTLGFGYLSKHGPTFIPLE